MGFSGGGLGVSLRVDGGWLGVVDRWLWWFVGFNGGGLWVLVDGFDINFEINGFWFWLWFFRLIGYVVDGGGWVWELRKCEKFVGK